MVVITSVCPAIQSAVVLSLGCSPFALKMESPTSTPPVMLGVMILRNLPHGFLTALTILPVQKVDLLE